MARMTPAADALRVRLVYDGPPHSGKTTSLGALAGGMASAVFSPAEAEGRTLYFDWLEYVGGSFEGIPIHCQILSVPGQPELAARRRALLAEADAVVFVTGSSGEQLAAAAAHLGELRAFLESRPAPRPGVVVQANHRDRADALPLAGLRGALDLEGLALVASVATENQGIREAFVLAVRLALDRARELLAQGALPVGSDGIESPAALLAWMQAAEAAPAAVPSAVSAMPAPAAAESAAPAVSVAGSRVPRLPDSGAPSGRVWPPVEGRMLLHTAASPGLVPKLGRDGAWRAGGEGWCFHSAAGHEFAQLDEAKQELLLWARKHAGGFDRLSPQRCLALTDTGWGTWRLWQVVRAEESLRQRLRAAVQQGAAAGELPGLARACAGWLLAARGTFQRSPPLPCRLEVIGESAGRPAYIGLLPPPSWQPRPEEAALADHELVEREIGPLLAAGAQGGA